MTRRLVRRAEPVSLALALLLLAGAALAKDGSDEKKNFGPTITPQDSGTTNRIQAVSAVNEEVVWVSGFFGTVLRTIDGGETWETHVVQGAEQLQLRDVEGVSARVAYVLSSGVGTDSRIYKTEDGGETWTLQFQNQAPAGFYDCFSFWSPNHGVTMGDSINGRFPVIETVNGETWVDIGDRLPPAQPSEGAFAASGTCVATFGRRRGWIATGAAAQARILATKDGGETWNAYPTPIVQGTGTSGNITVAFRDPRHGVLGGGELAAPTELQNNFARSRDGGKTWQLTTPAPFPGAVFGLSYADGDSRRRGGDGNDEAVDFDGDEGDRGGRGRKVVVATGPGGTAWTPDEGDTWFLVPGLQNYWAVAFASPRAGWLVAIDGSIVKISFGKTD
jgi:photosystem II stability/assembly factor-like uncharacterized protein